MTLRVKNIINFMRKQHNLYAKKKVSRKGDPY